MQEEITHLKFALQLQTCTFRMLVHHRKFDSSFFTMAISHHMSVIALLLQRAFTDNRLITASYWTRSPSVQFFTIHSAKMTEFPLLMRNTSNAFIVVADIDDIADVVLRLFERVGPLVLYAQPTVGHCYIQCWRVLPLVANTVHYSTHSRHHSVFPFVYQKWTLKVSLLLIALTWTLPTPLALIP